MTTYNIDFKSQGTETSPSIPGKSSISLPKNTVNTTSTSLALTGQGVSLYGEYQQENFIRLLENFASKTAPANPTIGQVWFDSVNNTLKVYNMDQQWIEVGSGLVTGTAAPTNPKPGHLWFNSTEHILYMYRQTTGTYANTYPRYHGGNWVQIWPAPVVYGGITEYNDIAARINKVIGTPQQSGTGAAEDTQWGWGETDVLPTYTNANTPGQFDNNAWLILIARLKKAIRHIDQAFVTENSVAQWGLINDGRGDGQATAAVYSPSYTWASGWNNGGIASAATWHTNMLAALTTLENNRHTVSTADTTWALLNTTSRGTWTSTKTYVATIQFGSQANARRFFNAGGQLRFNISLTGSTTGNAAEWVKLFTNNNTNLDDYTTSGFVIDYKGCKFGPAGMTYIGGAASIGYYDLTTSYKTLHTQSRGGAYGAGSVTIQAKTSTTGGWTVDVQITFTEDFNAGFMVDGTTAVALQIRKPTGAVAGQPTINTPVIANPSVTTSGTFVTAPAE